MYVAGFAHMINVISFAYYRLSIYLHGIIKISTHVGRIYRMFKEYKDIVSVSQLQSMLGIGKNTAYSLLKNNVIQSIRVGRVHKIPKANIIKYFRAK